MSTRSMGLVFGSVCAFAIAGCSSADTGDVSSESEVVQADSTSSLSLLHASLVPSDGKYLGRTNGEWAAKYWQWSAAIPAAHNPFMPGSDKDDDCAAFQSGAVWYLGGVYAPLGGGTTQGTQHRHCRMAFGRALFVGLVTTAFWASPPDQNATDQQLRDGANEYDNGGVFASLEVDGYSFPNMLSHRAKSPIFNLTLPTDNVFDDTPGTWRAAADGYYAMIRPLLPGRHVVHFHAGGPNPDYVLDITYDILVTPF